MHLTPRKTAVHTIASEGLEYASRHPAPDRTVKLPDLFGTNVFNDAVQRQRLPKSVYLALRRTIDAGQEIDPGIADTVANAMKDWAIERGATHYTHWFQPMTGLTAEKHDSFVSQNAQGQAMLEFSGKELIRGEPDASSFPSGGIRATFEARGYTAWDPTSPAFIRGTEWGATLIIPTAFCSWTGEALDKKTPLLRSQQTVDRQSVRLLHLIGETDVKRVQSTAGSEQEYFLVDRQFFYLRPDLVSCGRTLFGARPPKGQELEDHYFGAISQRVLAYMQDLEHELWKLGVPIRTRHNEVAPSQFELAPHFEQISVATDHNMLTMEIMRSLAERHGLNCLQHEKPFAGINGSGKHLNWSLMDNHGVNLLEPGHTPHDNLKFILFLTAIIRAVDLHQDLLRVSIASAGNDHRLGANEAPPAIMSIFLGAELEEIVGHLIEGTAPRARTGSGEMQLGVTTLPSLPRDTTDRNRTSPFAFTGNKFEFRAVGSSQSIAYPAIVLNTIVADSLDHLSTEIERRGGAGERREVIQTLVGETLKRHRRILFSGDNYSEEWLQEAERRGLLNLRSTPDALGCLATPENIALFARREVFSERETQARVNVLCDKYNHCVNVEYLSMRGMTASSILPAAIGYQERVARSISAVQSLDVPTPIDVGRQLELLGDVSERINRLKEALDRLAVEGDAAESSQEEALALTRHYHDRVIPAMEEVRRQSDALELLVDDDLWPLPKYRELLFIHGAGDP